MSLRSKDPWFLLLETADLMLVVPMVAFAKLFIRFGFEPLAWLPLLGYCVCFMLSRFCDPKVLAKPSFFDE